MQRTSHRLLALVAAVFLITAVLGAACSGASKSSAPAARSTASGTQRAGAAGGQSQIITTIRAGTVEAAVGSEAKAPVQALAVGEPGLGAWTIEVAYDPTVVSVTGCEGTETSACNIHKDDHTVRLAGAAATGLQDDVTLMTLAFQCKAAGTSQLKVSIVLLADATLGNPLAITASAEDGSVACTIGQM